jgi:WD40 repeat protein
MSKAAEALERAKRALNDAVPSADWDDLQRRLARRTLRRRISVITLGIAVGAFAVWAAALIALGRPQTGAPPRIASGQPVNATVPEGALLLRVQSDVELLVPDSNVPRVIIRDEDPLDVEGIAPFDMSPDGRYVLATLGHQTSSGPYLQTEILRIRVETGERTTLLRAGNLEGFGGPIKWSPSGGAFAYTLAKWDEDPDKGFPGQPTEQTLCVYDIAAGTSECFRSLGPVLSYDWEADGSGLLAAGADAIREVRLGDTSNSLVVADPTGAALRSVVSSALGAVPDQIQLAQVQVSSSGRFFSTIAIADADGASLGWVPVVFDSSGAPVATGRVNADMGVQAWAPDTDVLAYSMGVVGLPPPGAPTHAVRILNPSTGVDSQVLSLGGVSNIPGVSDPFVLALAWSPSGQWLAVGGREQVWVVDAERAVTEVTIRPYVGEDDQLVDWGPVES